MSFPESLKQIAIGLVLLLSNGCTPKPPEPPITLPFSLHIQGSEAETEFIISEDSYYSFLLVFKYKNQTDREKVKKLVGDVGGKQPDLGIPTPVVLEVVQLDVPLTDDEHIVSNMSGKSFRLTSWGGGKFHKETTRIPLMPGHYRARITSITDIPELEDTSIEFEIRQHFIK